MSDADNDDADDEDRPQRRAALHLVDALDERAPSPGELVALHARLKLLVMAHSPSLLARMGRLVAAPRALAPAELVARYRALATEALRDPAPRARHVNALEHMAGYFKRLAPVERRRLHARLDGYRAGLISLAATLALVRRLARRHHVDYLAQQIYLLTV